MFAVMKVAFSTAIALGISTTAFAASEYRITSRHAAVRIVVPAPRVYGSFAHCSPSSWMVFSRLQPGEAAIMIQDRGYRGDVGLPFHAGECW
jgi:hypothetical protein